MAEVTYDAERAVRTIHAWQVQADVLEDRAAELRELADEWERQVSDLRARAIQLAQRLARDGIETGLIDGSDHVDS